MVTTVAKSIDDVLSDVRVVLNDTGLGGSPYRYSNAVLISYLNTALRELYRLRPDAFIGNFTQGVLSINTMNTYEEADLGLTPATPLPVDDRLFGSPLAYYIAGRAELADDEFADDGRAMTLLQAFRAQLGNPGG